MPRSRSPSGRGRSPPAPTTRSPRAAPLRTRRRRRRTEPVSDRWHSRSRPFGPASSTSRAMRDRALDALADVLRRGHESDDVFVVVLAHLVRAGVLLRCADVAGAEGELAEARSRSAAMGQPWWTAAVLRTTAAVASFGAGGWDGSTRALATGDRLRRQPRRAGRGGDQPAHCGGDGAAPRRARTGGGAARRRAAIDRDHRAARAVPGGDGRAPRARAGAARRRPSPGRARAGAGGARWRTADRRSRRTVGDTPTSRRVGRTRAGVRGRFVESRIRRHERSASAT